MTIVQIQECLRDAGKPLTRAGLYFHFRKLRIKRRGVARPAIYPENAANRVLIRLGFRTKTTTKAKGRR